MTTLLAFYQNIGPALSLLVVLTFLLAGAVKGVIGLGLPTWSPLASGLLTGKYQGGIPEGSRGALENMAFLRDGLTNPAKNAAVAQLELAQRQNALLANCMTPFEWTHRITCAQFHSRINFSFG